MEDVYKHFHSYLCIWKIACSVTHSPLLPHSLCQTILTFNPKHKTSGSLNAKIFSFYPFAIHIACMPFIQILCVHPAVIITLSTLLKSWIPLQIRQYLYFHLQRFCNQKKKKQMYNHTHILLISNKHSWKMEVSLSFERDLIKNATLVFSNVPLCKRLKQITL